MFKHKINTMHVFFWLVKDMCWCLHLTALATLMVFPTVSLTGYILFTQKESREENLILTCWVMMNVFWMLHELHGTSKSPIYLFMGLGLISSAHAIYKLFGNKIPREK